MTGKLVEPAKIETVEMFDGSVVHLVRTSDDGDRCWRIEGTIRFKNEAIARAAFEQLIEVLNMRQREPVCPDEDRSGKS